MKVTSKSEQGLSNAFKSVGGIGAIRILLQCHRPGLGANPPVKLKRLRFALAPRVDSLLSQSDPSRCARGAIRSDYQRPTEIFRRFGAEVLDPAPPIRPKVIIA